MTRNLGEEEKNVRMERVEIWRCEIKTSPGDVLCGAQPIHWRFEGFSRLDLAGELFADKIGGQLGVALGRGDAVDADAAC